MVAPQEIFPRPDGRTVLGTDTMANLDPAEADAGDFITRRHYAAWEFKEFFRRTRWRFCRQLLMIISQPEACVPWMDTYIEKDLDINM